MGHGRHVRHIAFGPGIVRIIAQLVDASACPLASRMQKLSVASSTVQGGGKRRRPTLVRRHNITMCRARGLFDK